VLACRSCWICAPRDRSYRGWIWSVLPLPRVVAPHRTPLVLTRATELASSPRNLVLDAAGRRCRGPSRHCISDAAALYLNRAARKRVCPMEDKPMIGMSFLSFLLLAVIGAVWPSSFTIVCDTDSWKVWTLYSLNS
jgi:hypothetical protein